WTNLWLNRPGRRRRLMGPSANTLNVAPARLSPDEIATPKGSSYDHDSARAVSAAGADGTAVVDCVCGTGLPASGPASVASRRLEPPGDSHSRAHDHPRLAARRYSGCARKCPGHDSVCQNGVRRPQSDRHEPGDGRAHSGPTAKDERSR